MRNRNVISMIYANLEKASAAADEAAQTSAGRVNPVAETGCKRSLVSRLIASHLTYTLTTAAQSNGP